VETTCLPDEFSAVESDAEEERGENESHGACDYDAGDAA